MTTLPNRSRLPAGANSRLALPERQTAWLMCVVAGTLAVMSFLHLSGILGSGTRPFDRSDAGVAEAVICLALGYGAIRLQRGKPGARTVALVATGFAIVGFLVGLRFTLGGGDAIDLAYHLSALPILSIALVSLLRARARQPRRRGRARGVRS
jgi:asparagine N-glycosylation enzyme membrane subunit Stt3